MNRTNAVREHPEFPWLSLDDPAGLETFMRERSWLRSGERVNRCEKPGEGNMNLTIRVITDQRSLIIKQARPWVEKYEQIPAPWERSEFESRFYQRVGTVSGVVDRMPRLLGVDIAAHTLLLEDLVDGRSLTSLYDDDSLKPEELQQLACYLRSLHDATRGPADSSYANQAMRRLNHHHIFEFPLSEDNGIDLEQIERGLTQAVRRLREDDTFRGLIRDTGERYLRDGSVLLHGDFFPGSWLQTVKGVFVIDPEFCFYGDPEFDLGCAIAHFCLAQQPLEHSTFFLDQYAGHPHRINVQSSLLTWYAGTEVVRRLIGVAQLPIGSTSFDRAALLERARRAMITQSWETLWD